MPHLSTQKIVIEERVRETVAQRARVNDAWHSLRASRGVLVSALEVAVAAANAAPLVIAVYGIALGKSHSRRRSLKTFVRWMLERG
jgi:GH35 family endo-1,4-beta-xylanase